MEDDEWVPCDGKLYYQGIDIEEIVGGFLAEKRFGYEEVVYLLLKKSIKEEEGESLAIKILNRINEVLNNLSNEIGVSFKLYSFYDNVSSKYFINKDLEEFGYIKKITDKSSYNSAYFIEDEKHRNTTRFQLFA